MDNIELFLDIPSFNLEDLTISDEILTFMLESIQIDFD